jgi:hypothetical protein
VVTDLRVLRRRASGAAAAEWPDWEKTLTIGGDAEWQVNINEYFDRNRQQVIGDVGTRSGQFGLDLAVTYAGDVAAALRARLHEDLADVTVGAGEPLFQPDAVTPDTRLVIADAPVDAVEGHIDVDQRGGFTVIQNRQLQPHAIPATQKRELTALLGLRDTELALLSAESATTDDTAHIAELRAELNTARYDAYVARFGPISRVTTCRTGRTDPRHRRRAPLARWPCPASAGLPIGR